MSDRFGRIAQSMEESRTTGSLKPTLLVLVYVGEKVFNLYYRDPEEGYVTNGINGFQLSKCYHNPYSDEHVPLSVLEGVDLDQLIVDLVLRLMDPDQDGRVDPNSEYHGYVTIMPHYVVNVHEPDNVKAA